MFLHEDKKSFEYILKDVSGRSGNTDKQKERIHKARLEASRKRRERAEQKEKSNTRK